MRVVQCVEENILKNPKLNSTVSVIPIANDIIEFFKSNTRSQVRIRVENDVVLSIVNALNGEKSIDDLMREFDVSRETLMNLLTFMQERGLLDTIESRDSLQDYEKFRRVIHFIADYASSHEDLVEMWNNIRNGKVLIIGVGAVGSWVACNLVQSGVSKIYLMDGDVVDETNLHRQFGYSENDIGKHKVDVLEARMRRYHEKVVVYKSYDYLQETTLHRYDCEDLSLIINCADKPNVDITSLWVGEYGMKRNIPHIIGGGYNLHLSLIGQTVVPGKTACVKCFQKKLEEENKIDPQKVKKLAIQNRKVGSFGPMCSLIASMIGMEALKVLTKKIMPSNINRRGEFNIYNMNISYRTYEKRNDCEWCGKYGKYKGV